MRSISLIAHNLRSSHNIGSLLRTAEGLGVQHVFMTGYTPYPLSENDERMPHISSKVSRQIHKTALGAEAAVSWKHVPDIKKAISQLRKSGYFIAALEQSSVSVPLPGFVPADNIALIVGREVEGLEQSVIDLADITLEIPMSGSKESYNVAVAAAMALYHCKYGYKI